MRPILHLRSEGFRRETLIAELRQAHAAGYQAVNLHWERFPHSFEPEPLHSRDDVRAVDAVCAELGLEVIPTSHSFTHSDSLLRLPAFKHLDGGAGSLELTGDATVELMLTVARELQAAHPRASLVHMGGDEIFRFATTAASNGYVVRHGRSALYVDFVNRLAAGMRGLGLRLAIWSDMLIRYPEAAPRLDRSVQMWYWDYWGDGERSPFVSIGGGLSDLFVLDRQALRGDLRSLLFCHLAREGREIPIGHHEEFAHYWHLDAARRTARSFPYCAWFQDLELEHVACVLTIPEKGSFLPPVAQKLDHLRAFIRRSRDHGGSGVLTCSWGEYWQPLPMFWPGFQVALAIAADPDADDASVYRRAAAALGTPWTADALRGWCEAGAHLQFADILDNNWGRLPVRDRLAWLAAAGLLERDLRTAGEVIVRCDALLGGEMQAFPDDGWERYAVEDMAWRCRVQLACAGGDRAALQDLRQAGAGLRARALRWWTAWWPESIAAARVAGRYQPWEEAIVAALPPG